MGLTNILKSLMNENFVRISSSPLGPLGFIHLGVNNYLYRHAVLHVVVKSALWKTETESDEDNYRSETNSLRIFLRS